MQINTALFGPQEIQDDEIITFPQGLPGFESSKGFKVFHEEGKPTVHWLQSIEDEELCFSVMEPQLLNLGYEFILSDEQCQLIDLQEQDEFAVVVLLYKNGNTTPSEAESIPAHQTIQANLAAPVVINVRSRKAIQVLLPKTERITLIRSIA
ncbi:flagellar assembly protein FliW [Nitrincola tapanii]|nr:flagellar assembly protein FliW [Nitrincola tapanii]